MKIALFAALWALLLPTVTVAAQGSFTALPMTLAAGKIKPPPKVKVPPAPPHLDLEMTGREYQALLKANPALLNFATPGAQDLQPVLDAGKRNLDWLKFINDHRDIAHKISLTSKATQTGIPIDKPKKYNPELVREGYDKLTAKLPASFKAVVVEGGPFTVDPQMTDKEYADLGRAVDKSYQMAARWLTMAPYIDYLTQVKARDIRGYYFLSRDPDVQPKLSHWVQNSADDQNLFARYLLSMCMNAQEQDCPNLLITAITDDRVFDFYEKYFAAAKAVYESFFNITNTRDDVTWKPGAHEELRVPFVDPERDDLRDFLADNIQDEWKWGSWQLFLDFVDPQPDTAHLEFEAGTTPHVDGLAGDTITMDDNQPLTEYDIQWTIRHEFGHVLGFPDCYVEFYDVADKAIVSYQLDVNNLMCSRRGVIQRLHFDELEKAYAP